MIEKYIGYYKSPIGVLEIICSETALLSIMFVEEEGQSCKDNSVFKSVITQVDEYFDGKRKVFEVNIEFSGTEFQKTVWKELLNIPVGKTMTYKQMAEKLGCDNAYRAVGNANGKNKINIIVPCHRLIGSDNSLTGYGGGLHRKKWLLEHEANSSY